MRIFLLFGLLALLFFGARPLHGQDDGSYTVAPGDTLGAIAARFGVAVDSLAAVNGIADVNQIAVGQQLVIPTGNGAAALATIATGLVFAGPGDTVGHRGGPLWAGCDADRQPEWRHRDAAAFSWPAGEGARGCRAATCHSVLAS